METERERRRDLGSFLLAGVVGAAAAAVTAARRRPRRSPPRDAPVGLAAFEAAPCYRELVERERSADS